MCCRLSALPVLPSRTHAFSSLASFQIGTDFGLPGSQMLDRQIVCSTFNHNRIYLRFNLYEYSSEMRIAMISRFLVLIMLALALAVTPGCQEGTGLDPRERNEMEQIFADARKLDDAGRYHE